MRDKIDRRFSRRRAGPNGRSGDVAQRDGSGPKAVRRGSDAVDLRGTSRREDLCLSWSCRAVP